MFVTFADKRDGPSGFRYSVAPSPLVAPLSFRRMKQQVIFTMFGEVTAPELSSAVKSAARQSHARGGQG